VAATQITRIVRLNETVSKSMQYFLKFESTMDFFSKTTFLFQCILLDTFISELKSLATAEAPP